MDFIQFEAIDESQQNEINFSGDDDDEKSEQDENSIEDSEQLMEDVRLYRALDPENIDHYNKFPYHTRNPKAAVYEDDKMFFGTEVTQPKLFAPEDREYVEFDKFDGFEKSVQNFKDTLQNFKNSDNPLFGIMFKISEGKIF